MNKLSMGICLALFALPTLAVDRESSWVIPDLMMVDTDADGIADQNDQCGSTSLGSIVGANGCALMVERLGAPILNVRFETDQTDVQPDFFPRLADFSEHLKANPNRGVELRGHADQRGSFEYNQWLSEQRAISVKRILVEQFGVNARQLKVVGYSESQPVNDQELALNRRVETDWVDLNQGDQFQTIKTSN